MPIDVPNSDLTPALRAGFPLIKIYKGLKIPYPGWPTESNTAAEITQWAADFGNVGWRLGAADLVIDIDPRNFPADTDPFVDLFLDFGLMDLDMPHVKTAGGGHHFYLIKPPEMAIRETHPDYPGIEFKTVGRQVLIPPSYNEEKGRYYEWNDSEPSPSHRPNAPTDLLLFIQKTEIIGPRPAGGEMTTEQLEKLLARTDATAFTQDHDEWFKFMSACHHATQGDGGAVFEAWSQTDPMYAGDQSIRLRWDSLDPNHPSPITIQSFTHKLRELGVEMTELIVQPYLDNPLPPIDELPEDTETKIIREMNDKHCCIFNGKFRIGTKRYDSDLDKHYYAMSSVKDFTDYYANQTIETTVQVANGKMVTQDVNVGTFWQNHSKRLSYDGIVFAPNQVIHNKLNLWQGFSVEPIKGDCSLFLQLVREVLADGLEEVYTYVMKWLAYTIQQPQNKAKVALVLRGDKGAGKGFFGSTVLRLIHSHALHAISAEQILGRFNSHLKSTKLLFADEAFWAGSKDLEGVLKGLITEDFGTYEEKYQEVFSGRSCLNTIIASNAEWVVPTTPGDERRFCVMNVTNAWKGHHKKFKDFKLQMEVEGGLSALMYHLTHEISLGDWAPWEAIPHTEGMSEQIKEGFDDVQTWLYECLQDGLWPGAENEWPIDEGTHWAPKEGLFHSYLHSLDTLHRNTWRVGKQKFCQRLKKFSKGTIRDEQKTIDRIRVRGLMIPNLKAAREIFEEQVKYKQIWLYSPSKPSTFSKENPFESSIYA